MERVSTSSPKIDQQEVRFSPRQQNTRSLQNATPVQSITKLCVLLNQTRFLVGHFFSSSFSSFFVEVSRTPPSRVLLLTPSRTCLDAAASLPPLWASNDSVLHLLLCERLCISSFDSLYYATPDLFFFSICRRQWWLSLLDLLCSKVFADFPSLRFMIEILILIIILIYFSIVFSCLFRLNLIIFDYQSVIFVCVWESVRF